MKTRWNRPRRTGGEAKPEKARPADEGQVSVAAGPTTQPTATMTCVQRTARFEPLSLDRDAETGSGSQQSTLRAAPRRRHGSAAPESRRTASRVTRAPKRLLRDLMARLSTTIAAGLL